MNQAELRHLAEERILDAAALIAGGRWSFAYYVAGYAVECALKSCVLARMVHTGWVFELKVKIDDVLTHDFTKLIAIAGLGNELNNRFAASAQAAAAAGGPPGGAFVRNWGTVLRWDVASRYTAHAEAEASDLYRAVTESPDGVLPWIRNFW